MQNKGFTYLEVLLGVMLLGLILIPLLSQFYIGFQGNKNATLVTQSVDLASDLMEEIKSRRFDENEFPDDPVPAASLGTDAGENATDRTTFDDIDDYNGWQSHPPKTIDGNALTDFSDFTRKVTVTYVILSGSNWVASGTATHYKEINVTVTHPDVNDRVLETIVSHY